MSGCTTDEALKKILDFSEGKLNEFELSFLRQE